MKYSLGPVLYYWPKETLEDFYQQAANCSADTIYLGEAVCSKRRATKVGDWIEMAKTLAASGKQVVLSTLALVQASSELGELKRYVDNGEFLIEASDLGVVNLCAERKLPFVAGHALNCYNAVTLRLLRKQGMVRWCMPVELSRDWLANLLTQCEELGIRNQFEVEVLSYGHLPLAIPRAALPPARKTGQRTSAKPAASSTLRAQHAVAGEPAGVRAQRYSDHERLRL
ncbi:putative protease [Klebsiella pneumoniae]|uniref:Putative protease n=1 Tax=Klebsiella pneumoniae TaxID=573 RepID=A0A2X3CS17_KLEPN|nr:putative protease [Klebsiella pneumoniae]